MLRWSMSREMVTYKGSAKDTAHAGPRDAVDEDDADGGDQDQDDAEGRRLIGAARDIKSEDAVGDGFPPAEGQEQHGRGLLQRGHEREQAPHQDALPDQRQRDVTKAPETARAH